jgi:hypothetical protein
MSVLAIAKKFNIRSKAELSDHLGDLINGFLTT